MNIVHSEAEQPLSTGRNPARSVFVTVPESAKLSDHQLCGRSCAWCQRMLVGRPSVDLGERDDVESGRRLFPRACPACTCGRVYQQLVVHTATCEQCARDGAMCAESSELQRALREGRRL